MIKPYHLLLTLLIIGCAPSATRKLQRAKKLIAQAELKGAKVESDTVKNKIEIKGESTRELNVNIKDSIQITKKDSIVYNKKDTTIYHFEKKTIWKHPKDTTINSNGIEVNIKFSNGKLSIKAKCPDKEIIEKTAINNKISCNESDFTKFCRWFFIIFCCLASVFIAFKLKSFFNPI